MASDWYDLVLIFAGFGVGYLVALGWPWKKRKDSPIVEATKPLEEDNVQEAEVIDNDDGSKEVKL